jgi:dynein heavy chain
MLDAWLAVQRQWLYLQPIFHTRDIQQQLPLETKRFKTVHRMWRNTMNMVHTNRNLIHFCSVAKHLEMFQEANRLLDQVRASSASAPP